VLIALPVSPSLGMLVERHDALSDRYKAQLMGGGLHRRPVEGLAMNCSVRSLILLSAW